MSLFYFIFFANEVLCGLLSFGEMLLQTLKSNSFMLVLYFTLHNDVCSGNNAV